MCIDSSCESFRFKYGGKRWKQYSTVYILPEYSIDFHAMGNFSSQILSDSISRRLSELSSQRKGTTQSVEGYSVANTNSNSKPRSFLSVLETLSGSSNWRVARSRLGSTDPMGRPRSFCKEKVQKLIQQEISQVILKKILDILKDSGVQAPVTLQTTVNDSPIAPRKIAVHIANSSPCVYLPYVRSKSVIPEYSRATDLLEDNEESSHDPEINGPDSEEDPLQQKLRDVLPSNYLSSPFNSYDPIPHLFAVIIEVEQDNLSVGPVHVTFQSNARTDWTPAFEERKQILHKEIFSIASHSWVLELDKADYFISNVNSNEHLDRRTSCRELADRSCLYHLAEFPKTLLPPEKISDLQLLKLKAGLYLFLLPLIIPGNIPATVNSFNGSLLHNLFIEVPIEGSTNFETSVAKATFELPMVRTPPSLIDMDAEKPIHISRTWNNSLHYLITFPRTCVSLGSKYLINVKISPLTKNIVLKRVRFNIMERTEYVPRESFCKCCHGGTRGCCSKLKLHGPQDRVVTLCELRTRKSQNPKAAPPFKVQVIKCHNDNMLDVCYEAPSNPSCTDVIVASPLDIDVELPFLTSRADLESSVFALQEGERSMCFASASSKKCSARDMENISSSIVGSSETQLSYIGFLRQSDGKRRRTRLDSSSVNSLNDSCEHQESTAQSQVLFPDSNFKYIQISHRLQVLFRISKPDPRDNKIHHYKIVVATPLTLLSAKCNEGSTQLPNYENVRTEPVPAPRSEGPAIKFRIPQDSEGLPIRPLRNENEYALPSFQEAMSSPSSPSFMLSEPAPPY